MEWISEGRVRRATLSRMRFVYEGAISSKAMGGARLHFGGMARALGRRAETRLELVLPAFSDEQPFAPEVGLTGRVRYVKSFGRTLEGHIFYELAKCALIGGLRLRDIATRRSAVHMMRISPIGLSPLVARMLSSTVVVEVNGMPDAEFAARGFARPVVSAVRLITNLQLRAATHVVTVTEATAEAVRLRCSAPVMRLENAIDPDDLRSAIARCDEGAAHTIAYSGAFAPWQELRLLVRAFASLVDQQPDENWRLLLIGDGEDRRAIEDEITRCGVADRTEITGWVDRDVSVDRLLEARIAVVPLATTEEDGKSPLKLFEYLAIGRSVVASEVDGITELEGYPIVKYRSGDEQSLARAIVEAIDAPRSGGVDDLLPMLAWDERADRLLRFVGVSET